jgi:site-specific recombinase XerD
LRHTFASWQAEAGTDIFHIAKLLGHATVQMSARYAHLGNGVLQAAMKRLPALPAGEPAAQGRVVKLRKRTKE